MNRNHEEDEFVAVRVQDPRIQNEGSWNSYVDYKIFLHTNSKAFTAKTSCVRRRYSEFVWLRKKLQKNAGLVPVPDLPGKSFFSFSNEDFLESRRKGLQAFLDKVVNMTVCLSDSQLHLFLQTQLPVGHIQDCVQGHTPYSVTDAILTYASSNWGLAQAQEDDPVKEPSLTVSYESMESPAPHQPCLQPKETFSPELLSCGDSDPGPGLLELRDGDSAELQRRDRSSVRITQRDNHLEAVVECDCGPTEVAFFLGENQDEPESPGLVEQTQRRSCRIQTPVEVHSPMGAGFDEDRKVDAVREEECGGREEEKPDDRSETKAERLDGSKDSEEQLVESNATSQEEELEAVSPEEQVLENHVVSEVNGLVDHVDVGVSDVSCPEEPADGKNSYDSGSKAETPLESEVHAETESGDAVEQTDQNHVDREADSVGTKDESDEDSRSLPSSNESIAKVSDDESDGAEDPIRAANGFVKTPPEDASRRNILDLQMNGKEDISAREDEDLRYMTSVDLNSSDLTESSDFSVLESSCAPEAADGKRAERETLSSLSLDASEDAQAVQMCH